MNGFEVTVAFDSASWKSATLEVAILAKKRMRKKIDFVVTIRTKNPSSHHTNSGKSQVTLNAIING